MNNRIVTLVFSILTLLLLNSPVGAAVDTPMYTELKLSGTVNPIVADYLVRQIEEAPKEGDDFILLLLDTPGGLVTSMREIVQGIMNSEIPVVVYTAPKGAQAASAGGFIMLSAHIAAMAPGTEIGAMHPVSPQLDFMQKDPGGDPAGVMEKKVLNDTVAFARSLAQQRDRNVEWTERAVKDAVSATYLEAKELGVIDIVAEDVEDLLQKIDGKSLTLKGETVLLSTANARPRRVVMNWKERMLNWLANPELMMILFIIAIAGIGMEFKNPGMIVPGALGAVALFLFLTASSIIPINAAGAVLILLALGLFIAELYITSFGLLTLAGLAAFIFGSMILFDSPLPGGRIPMSTIIVSALTLLAFVFFVIRAVVKVYRQDISMGENSMVGMKGVARGDFDGSGTVLVRGEIWKARSTVPLAEGQEVRVTGIDGMIMQVEPLQGGSE